ncbi:lysozyme [Caulobacter sp. D4A]|nr:lysozyme [Caulobacter sp. D4A]PXA96823.1 lysozyme [Caulobacter sp. D5]
MKRVDFLVVHCSATPVTRDIGAKEIRQMHMQQGWADIGYHYVIRRDGRVDKGRADTVPGAHVQGFNSRSLGICMVGGVKPDGKTAEANFTDAQYAALRHTLDSLKHAYPDAVILGHRDLSPDRNRDGKVTKGEWLKECPTFDAGTWYAGHPVEHPAYT